MKNLLKYTAAIMVISLFLSVPVYADTYRDKVFAWFDDCLETCIKGYDEDIKECSGMETPGDMSDCLDDCDEYLRFCATKCADDGNRYLSYGGDKE